MYAEPRGADELRPQPHPIPHEPRQKERPTTRSAVWWGAPLYAVPRAGLEPARTCVHWCLRPTRLPIPPSGHRSVGSAKIRQFRLLHNTPRGLEGGGLRGGFDRSAYTRHSSGRACHQAPYPSSVPQQVGSEALLRQGSAWAEIKARSKHEARGRAREGYQSAC